MRLTERVVDLLKRRIAENKRRKNNINPAHSSRGDYHKLVKMDQAKLSKVLARAHSQGMAKVGRQKSDMSGGNSVNRNPHKAAVARAKRILRAANTISGAQRGNPVYRAAAAADLMAMRKRGLTRIKGLTIPVPRDRSKRKPLTFGVAGKKGPASASSVSAARKKAWATRRKKFGKSGGKKRR